MNRKILNLKYLSQEHLVFLIVLLLSTLIIIQFLLTDLINLIPSNSIITGSQISNSLLLKLLPLRLTIAFIFTWNIIDSIKHPDVFKNLANTFLKKLKILHNHNEINIIWVLHIIIELLIILSLTTGKFMDIFSILGMLIIISSIIIYEEIFNTLLIRDLSILGGLMSLFIFTL